MKKFLLLLTAWTCALGLVSCRAAGKADTPTAADIEKSIVDQWTSKGDSLNAPKTVQVNSIKIGSGAKANAQDEVDGIPPGHRVTIALVDFTVREHYPKRTRAVRRVRECKVYQDQFGDWRVMLGQVRGHDESTDEPADK